MVETREGPKLPILEDGHLGIDLPERVTLERAKEIIADSRLAAAGIEPRRGRLFQDSRPAGEYWLLYLSRIAQARTGLRFGVADQARRLCR